MSLDNFSRNMIALRNRHNLTTAQVAAIAGVEKASYEKMELGFETVSYEVLEKLAKFYNVDVTYFAGEGQVEQKTNGIKETSAVAPKQPKPVPQGVKGVKAFNILTLITACLLLVCFVIVPMVSGYTDYWGTVTFFVWHMFGGGALEVIVAVLFLIYVIWALVHAIIHMASANINLGTYGLVSKIISIVLNGLLLMFEIILLIASNFAYTIMLVHVAITILDLVFNIIKIVKHVKSNKKA